MANNRCLCNNSNKSSYIELQVGLSYYTTVYLPNEGPLGLFRILIISVVAFEDVTQLWTAYT